MSTPAMVLDASAMVDLLVGSSHADAVRQRVAGGVVHVPAHFDAEVLSAIGRLARAGLVSDDEAAQYLELASTATFARHDCAPLLMGAWRRRRNLRVVDALYVELGATLGVPVVTTDARLARAAEDAELVA